MNQTKDERVANRYIPNNVTKTIDDGHCIVYYFVTSQGKPGAIGFKGTAGKSSFYMSFRDEERRDVLVNDWRHQVAAAIDRRNERREARKAFVHTMKVGDILVSSWGYDQTNIDFYQVVEVNGKYVTVRELNRTVEPTEYLQGTCMPVADSFKSSEKYPDQYKPLRRIVKGNEQHQYIDIESFASASPWDGKEEHWTAYA